MPDLFTVDFPPGLTNLERAWFDASDAIIGSWAGTGIAPRTFNRGYALAATPPAGAVSIAWRASELIGGVTVFYGASAEIEAPLDLAPVLTVLNSIQAGRISIQSPVLSGGRVELVRGDAYRAIDTRAVQFAFAGGLVLAVAPRLATVALIIEGATWTQLGTFTTITGGIACSFELSATQTQGLAQGSFKYWVKAITLSGDPFDLAEGTAHIRTGS